jgi:hypothetical protein
MNKKTATELSRQIEHAKYLVRRNLPVWPSTFGLCENECGRANGRGSGPCIECAMDELALLIGRDEAITYYEHVKELNRKERGDDEEE